MYEIEHKFLVDVEKFNSFISSATKVIQNIKQGYVIDDSTKGILRVRIANGDTAFFTYKRATNDASKRIEIETTIPVDKAEFLFNTCEKRIAKTRYIVFTHGRVWDVDVYTDRLQGLVVAEIELESTDVEYAKPEWVTTDITHDNRFSNYNLAEADESLLIEIGLA